MSEVTVTPRVQAEVKITPAKRRATFKVNIAKAPLTGPGAHRGIALVGVKEVRLTLEPYAHVYYPSTLAATDALIELLQAVRAELIEQGVDK